jgi:hypothetical protein
MLDWLFAYGSLVVGALFTAGALYKEAEEYLAKKKTGKPLLILMFGLLSFCLWAASTRLTKQERKQPAIRLRPVKTGKR